jgi:CHAT domain-containing protein
MVDPRTAGCPEPEVLAAYADQGLSLTERTRVDAHLASCPQCIAVLAGVARTAAELSEQWPDADVMTEASPSFTWRGAAGALAAAAAVIAVIVTPALVRPWLDRDTGLVSLVDSVGEQRSVLGRLTGGFPHTPLGAPSAGGQDGPASGADRVQLIAGKIRESFGERHTPSQLHALGVAQLLSKRYDDAAQALLAASREQPANAQYLSDVAAVQIERARLGLRPDDLPRALAAADRARRLDPSLAEAWFNRALAATALSLTAEARTSWTEYLKRDATSPWAAEARSRLEELSRPTPAAAWTEMEGRLQRSIDVETADAAVRAQTTEARLFIENTLLVEWADAVLTGGDGSGELERLRVMAQAMSRIAGDHLYADTVAAIDRLPADGRRPIARAHRVYADAAALFVDDRATASIPGLTEARNVFEKAGYPFVSRVALDLAYTAARTVENAAALERLGAVARAKGYANIATRIAWQQGLTAMLQGQLAEAQNRFEETLSGAEAMGDQEQTAAAHNLLATLYQYLGDTRNEWTHRSKALAGLSISRNLRFRFALIGTAAVSTRIENPEAAPMLHDAALTAARRWGRAAAVTEALSQRAATRLVLGRTDDAARDLADARTELARVPDPVFRSRLEIPILTSESDLLRPNDPEGAISAANRAIELVTQRGDRLRLAQLNLRLAKANIARGRLNDAQLALSNGLKAFEEERSNITDEGRISTLDESWQLYDTALHLAIKSNDLPRAFALAERARARSLAEAKRIPAEVSLRDVEAALGAGDAVIALNQFDDELAIWTIRRSGTEVVTRPLSRQDAQRLVERQGNEITFGSVSAEASRSLYNAIVRPVAQRLSGAERIVIVPDASFETAAFSALLDPSTNRFLIETVMVSLAPSASAFATSRRSGSTRAANSTTLVFGGAGDYASGEASRIASVYPSAAIVAGSDATRARLFADLAVPRRIAHLAVPVRVSATNPLLSRALIADEPGVRHSGAILGRDIAKGAFADTNLVVIDEAERGLSLRGEGTLSMSRAFMAAGVPAVLGTLPGADENATRDLMIGFHREMSRNIPAEQALQTVQRNAIQQNGRRLGAWTALVLYGSDR